MKFSKPPMRILIVLFFIVSVSMGQNSKTLISLQTCVNEAITNNIQLLQSKLQIDQSEILRKQANAAILPDLNANANQGWNFGRSIDPSTNQFVNQQIRSNNFGISSNLILFNGFRIQHTIAQANATEKATQYEYEENKNNLILNVVNAYLQVLFNKELLKNNQNQSNLTNSQLERTQKLVQSGILPETNLYTLKSQLSTDELAIVNANNQLNQAKLNLIMLMNTKMMADSLELFDIEPINIPKDTNINYGSPDEIYTIAEKKQPSILGPYHRIISANIGVKVAKASVYPRLTLQGNVYTIYSSSRTQFKGYSLGQPVTIGYLTNDPTQTVSQPTVIPSFNEYPFVNQVNDNISQSVSLNLTIPIFNNRNIKTSIDQAQIRQKNAELNFQNAKIQLKNRIIQAYYNVEAALKRKSASILQKNAADESFRISEKRYLAGVANSIDYMVVLNNLNRANSELLQATYDLALKIKILEFYKGIDLNN
ncbi:MAG: TolC family protein [Bacteroidota bacterium]|nr:TolC family protein [Bacteroidota bacterium]